MELLILFITIAVFVILAWFYFRGKESPAPTIRKARDAVDEPASSAASSQGPPASEIIEPSLPAPLEHVKEPIRTGIQQLFSQEEKADSRQPLSYENLDREILAKAEAQIDAIHNFRAVHHRLQQILNDPALNVTSALSSVIMADPILSSKVLKIVNSAYFGRAQKVNSIGHALFLLGMVQLREILYREGLLEVFKINDSAKDGLIEVFWRHATITSIIASHLRNLFPGLDQGTLFTAGLIHDVGKLILVRMDDLGNYTTRSTIHDEDRIFGINHIVIGRIALEKWGFSDLMISLVTNHHNPSCVPLQTLKLSGQAPQYLMVLFLANQLAKIILADEDYLPANHLHPSYHAIIDQDNFRRAALDGFLLAQIGKSEAFLR